MFWCKLNNYESINDTYAIICFTVCIMSWAVKINIAYHHLQIYILFITQRYIIFTTPDKRMNEPITPPPNPGVPVITPSKAAKAEDESSKTRPSICLHVPLQGVDGEKPNVVIDFMRLAEDSYGYEVIHPDIRSVLDLGNDVDDNDDDDDNEDIDLMTDRPRTAASGTAAATPGPSTPNATNAGTVAAPEKPKSRSKIEGKYDLNDPFIDDSEMLWEEQAASTKDGFFVFSGPLVQAGEQPEIERADGTMKRTKGDAAKGVGKGKGAARGKKKEPAAKKAKVEKDGKEKTDKTEKETKETNEKVVRPKKEKATKKTSVKEDQAGSDGHVLIAPKPKDEKEKQTKTTKKKVDKAEKTEPKGDEKKEAKSDEKKEEKESKESSKEPKDAFIEPKDSFKEFKEASKASKQSSSTTPEHAMEGGEPTHVHTKVMSINGLLDP